MTEPLISIIVPVYKAEKYIHRCVESLTKQTLTDIEIILVDDGSPDNCPNYVVMIVINIKDGFVVTHVMLEMVNIYLRHQEDSRGS